jgi:hypothetical protein
MKSLVFLSTLVLSLYFIEIPAIGKTKSSSLPIGKSCAKVVSASSQRTIPGTKESSIETQFNIRLQWLCNERPEAFFFKSKEGWMNCTVSVSKDNQLTEISPEDVKKADFINLMPIKGGKFPIPKGASKLNNVIIFKTNKSNWHYVALPKIIRKPDIIMQ